MYLVIIIGKKYWFTTSWSARRGLQDFSKGRGIIEDICKADPWSVDIKVVDEVGLKHFRTNYEKIK